MIKFIATDMDGTLLNSNNEIHADFYPMFQSLKEKDIIFAAASGRQYYNLLERFKDINEAYQTLINEQTRKKYDRMWNSKIKRKMAKEQNISLNPSKISGNCGRLMCCLKYENEVYEDKLKRLPNVGAIVKTEDGEGEVDGVETLKERVKVKFKTEDGDGYTYKRYDAKDIKVIKDVAKERIDEEELENKKELEELEKLEKEDEKNSENI